MPVWEADPMRHLQPENQAHRTGLVPEVKIRHLQVKNKTVLWACGLSLETDHLWDQQEGIPGGGIVSKFEALSSIL